MSTEFKEALKVPRSKMLKNVRELFKHPIKLLSGQFVEYGSTYKAYLGFDEIHLTQDADCIQHFMQKSNRSFSKTKLNAMLAKSIGNGLLNADGEYWLRQRRLIQPGFHKQKLEELSKTMIYDIESFGRELESSTQQNEAIDLTKSMMKLTINVVLNSLFGSSISPEQINRLDEIITAVQHYIVAKVRIPFAKYYFKVNGRSKQIEGMLKELDDLIYGIIQQRREHEEKHDDLLDMLLQAKYEDNGEGMTDKQLRDESLIMLVAGHETSAIALTWTFYLLSQHPEIEQKVLDEIRDGLNGNKPGFDDLKKLSYTKQVIQESMRLYPPAWIVDRESQEANSMNGYQLKKGDIVNAFIFGLHRNPEYWEMPFRFKPERFEPAAQKSRHPFSYMPFGGGPRLCIGNNFAIMEMQLAVAMLLPKFKFTPVDEKVPELEALITLRPKGGLPVVVTER